MGHVGRLDRREGVDCLHTLKDVVVGDVEGWRYLHEKRSAQNADI